MVSRELYTFLALKRSRRLSANTSIYYENQLRPFQDYTERMRILYMDQITTQVINEYLWYYEPQHSDGGLWHLYSTLKAFLRWYDRTAEPNGWRNPIDRVDPPKRNKEPIPGITPDEFTRIIAMCNNGFYGCRDRAIMCFLYDTGVRVTELCCIKMSDVDLKLGVAFIAHGKGDKARFAVFGDACRIELNKYIRKKRETDEYLFTNRFGEQLKREAIRSLILKYANIAGITSIPSPHDFRRAWVHETRKVANDLDTARGAGHADTKMLPRYDFQTAAEIAAALSGSSPLDNLKKK